MTPDRANPYVGPDAFRRRDSRPFCGRERETQALTSLIISAGEVLFYAQSGAGKSSLINAGVIPELEAEGFEVLPVARVSGEQPEAYSPENPFTFNVLSYLEGGDEEAMKPWAAASLADYTADGRPQPAGDPRRQVLILDQFEELLTLYPERPELREVFFRQIREALRANPLLSVVFVAREDRIAGLDRYAVHLPGCLRTRFHMERLRREPALAAIREPAAEAGRPFEPGVAERIVDDLRQERVAGSRQTILGAYVQPVSLQVVCRELWQGLRWPGGTITERDLDHFGNTDRALEKFYDRVVAGAAGKTGSSEAEIRRWIEKALISPAGVRRQALEEELASELRQETLQALVDEHLLRTERVRGAIWYELAHDRLIEPVRTANERRVPVELRQVAVDAARWRAAKRPSHLLYGGQQLSRALDSARRHPEALGDLEHQFLEMGGKQRWKAIGFAALIMVIVGVMLVVLIWLRVDRLHRESEAKALAYAATKALAEDPGEALQSALKAVRTTYLRDGSATIEAEEVLHRALQAPWAEVQWHWQGRGEEQEVQSLALDRSGTRLAALLDGVPVVWQVGTEELPLLSLEQSASVIALSPDGNLLAATSDSGTVRLWRVPSGEEFPPLEIQGEVTALAFDPGSEALAVGSGGGEVTVWALRGEGAPWRLAPPTREVRVEALAYGPTRLAAAYDDGRVRVWGPERDRDPIVLSARQPVPPHTLAFSTDERWLAMGSTDGTAQVWEVEVESAEWSCTVWDEAGISQLAFTAGPRLVTLSFEGRLKLWDLEACQAELAPGKFLRDTTLSADGEHLATASDGTLTVYRLRSPEGDSVLRLGAGVLAVDFSPDGRRLATGDQAGGARIWDLESRELRTLGVPRSPVNSVAFSPGGDLLATASNDGKARLWRLPPGELVAALDHPAAVTEARFSPDGELLATACVDGQVRLSSAATGVLVRRLPGVEAAVWSLAFSPRGDLLVAGDDNGQISIWEVPSFRLVQRVETQLNSAVTAVAFHPSGRWFAVTDDNGEMKLFDAPSGREQSSQFEDGRLLLSAAFSPLDGRLAVAGMGGASLWDLRLSPPPLALNTPGIRINDLAFRADGKLLALAGDDGSVRLEPMDLDDLIAQAEERLPEREDGDD